MDGFWGGVTWALAPTVLVGLVFWFIMRSIVRADRTERKVYARMEAEERAKRGLPHKPGVFAKVAIVADLDGGNTAPWTPVP